MAAEPDTLSDREQRLGEIVFAAVRAQEEGRPVDRGELLARHPEFAAELAEFFAGRDELDRLAAPLRAAAGPSGVPAWLAAAPGQSFGGYELERELGRGGMGVVYRARQPGLNRVVALKVFWPLGPTGDADARRFRNEAETAAALDH